MFLTGRGSLPSREEALFFLFKSLVLRGQFPQHILQDSAIQEIFQFIGSIYAAERLEGFRLAIGAGDDHVDRLARLQSSHVLNREGLLTGKRSEEHTSELQSLMRISYAVFCLQKNKKRN